MRAREPSERLEDVLDGLRHVIRKRHPDPEWIHRVLENRQDLPRAGGRRWAAAAHRVEDDGEEDGGEKRGVLESLSGGLQRVGLAEEREEKAPGRSLRRARGARAAELRQERVEQAGLRPETIRVVSPSAPQGIEKLLGDARRGAFRDFVAQLGDGLAYVFGHCKREARRELAGAEHPDRILPEADEGVADRAHDAPFEILDAAHEVEDGIRRDVVEESVDREVAAERVFLRRAERVVRADQEIVGALLALFALGRVGCLPERRHLDDLPAFEEDVREAEAPPDHARVAKEAPDFLRSGVGADVEVLGRASRHEVADGSSDEIRLVAGAVQPVQDAQCVRVDIAARNGMFGARQDAGNTHPAGCRIDIELQL